MEGKKYRSSHVSAYVKKHTSTLPWSAAVTFYVTMYYTISKLFAFCHLRSRKCTIYISGNDMYMCYTNMQRKRPPQRRPRGSEPNISHAYCIRTHGVSEKIWEFKWFNKPCNKCISYSLVRSCEFLNTQHISHDNMGDRCQVDYMEWWGDVSLFFSCLLESLVSWLKISAPLPF